MLLSKLVPGLSSFEDGGEEFFFEALKSGDAPNSAAPSLSNVRRWRAEDVAKHVGWEAPVPETGDVHRRIPPLP